MKKCILIFDDEIEILMLCKIILQRQNYKVETRITCDNVIADIKSIKPDIIIMDLWIPKMGGEYAIRQIRQDDSLKNIPIVICSANDEIAKISRVSAANDYVRKPFDIHEFTKIVEKWI